MVYESTLAFLHRPDGGQDGGTIMYYGDHSVLHETHALQWKDCVKVFLFENSGINHLCLMFCEKLKTWWNDNHTVVRELCVCNECIVKCAF